MKFLHTGDWHLGKTVYEHSMIEDQRHFIKQIIELFENAQKENEPYDAILISGDIYDRAIPSLEAVKLLNDFLLEMNDKFPKMHIFILAGNHDGAERLGFASDFLKKMNIHIATDVQKLNEPIIVNGVAIYQIPNLTNGNMKVSSRVSENELYKMATDSIKKAHNENANTKDLPLVVSAHATVYGCFDFEKGDTVKKSDIEVGTLSSIEKEIFDDFTYTALGHIHKYQKLTEKMYYSGSPISYTFDDNQKVSPKFFISVEIDKDKEKPKKIETIPVNILHPVSVLNGLFSEFYDSEKFDEYKNHYLELHFTDKIFINKPKEQLKAKFPYLLATFVNNIISESESNLKERLELKNKGNEISEMELFELFMKDLYENQTSKAPSKEIILRTKDEIKEEIELFEKEMDDVKNSL